MSSSRPSSTRHCVHAIMLHLSNDELEYNAGEYRVLTAYIKTNQSIFHCFIKMFYNCIEMFTQHF